ncbi:hypothetical protein [Nocardia sp. NPDC058633]|uniref:hypothetical protein n=1 Tax=Nocardia sp. NPDC058633 TaxID=3346568 RepID=UPI00364645D8
MRTLSSGLALDAMRNAALSVLPPQVPRAVIVYGSFGRMQQKPTSDLDVLFIGDNTPRALAELTSVLIAFSHCHGLPLDEEVPYANKLLVDWEELSAASTCDVFAGSPRLTTVRRGDPCFLSSDYMRSRLLVTGVLAQRTLGWSEDPLRLDSLRARAGAGLVRAAFDDVRSADADPDVEAVVDYITGEKGGILAADWLGFDPDPATRRHLSGFAEYVLHTSRFDRKFRSATSDVAL